MGCACVCVRVHACACVCMRVRARACVCVHACVCVQACSCACASVFECARKCVQGYRHHGTRIRQGHVAAHLSRKGTSKQLLGFKCACMRMRVYALACAYE